MPIPDDKNEGTSENRRSDLKERKKIGWSQRFFIFAAVMFLLGWASTGFIGSAEDQIDLGFLSELRSQQTSQQDTDQSSLNLSPPSEADSSQYLDTTGDVDQATEDNPGSEELVIDQAEVIPTEMPLNTETQSQMLDPDNWGDWYCANCVAVPVHVKVTHYWPPLGGDNCWSYYDDYCYSPTKSTVPWESVIEISAACPVPWLGAVVEIPDINRRYLCLDTGDKVICKDGTCVVDVLTNEIHPWDGLEFEALVYYPRVWVEPAPTFTPIVSTDQ